MKLSTNVINFYQPFGIYRTIDIFSEAGFEAIDFNFDLEEYRTDTHDAAFYRQLRDYAAARGIAFTQAHAPFSTTFTDPEKTAARFEEILRSIENCAPLGTEMLVVHPGNHRKWREDDSFEEMFALNLELYRRLASHAKHSGVKIAIENIPGSVTDTPEGLIRLIDTLNDPVFTVCFDVGHAHLMGLDVADFIRRLGSRIGCTHIHDNNGSTDGHTLPYYGTMDWNAVTAAFAEMGYKGDLSYEAGAFVTRLPAELRPQAARYMAQVGKHLISAIQA